MLRVLMDEVYTMCKKNAQGGRQMENLTTNEKEMLQI